MIPKPIFALYLIVITLAWGVSDDVVAQGFACERATTNVERMICGDEVLRQLDAELAGIYRIRLKESGEQTRLDQRRWLAEVRNKCVNRNCLDHVYRARIVELDIAQFKILKSEPTNVSRFDQCVLAPESPRWLPLIAFLKKELGPPASCVPVGTRYVVTVNDVPMTSQGIYLIDLKTQRYQRLGGFGFASIQRELSSRNLRFLLTKHLGIKQGVMWESYSVLSLFLLSKIDFSELDDNRNAIQRILDTEEDGEDGGCSERLKSASSVQEVRIKDSISRDDAEIAFRVDQWDCIAKIKTSRDRRFALEDGVFREK